MRDQNLNTVYIVSAERADKTAEINELTTSILADFLRRSNVPHQRLLGCYQGVEEVSFLIHDRTLARKVAVRFEQESYLILEVVQVGLIFERLATICYIDEESGTDGLQEKLGRLEAVSEAEARACDDWTFNPSTDTWYVVR